MIALITGDRNWIPNDGGLRALYKLYHITGEFPTTIIHGDCRGIDKTVSNCWKREITQARVIAVSADWKTYGRGAGPIRNHKMLDMLLSESGRRVVVAFHRCLGASRGTRNMVSQAIRAGIDTYLVADEYGNMEKLL